MDGITNSGLTATTQACWPNGKALDYESRDCRFDPCVGHLFSITTDEVVIRVLVFLVAESGWGGRWGCSAQFSIFVPQPHGYSTRPKKVITCQESETVKIFGDCFCYANRLLLECEFELSGLPASRNLRHDNEMPCLNTSSSIVE